MTDDESASEYQPSAAALHDDAMAFANAIVLAKVRDSDEVAVQRLIESLNHDMTRDLPDGPADDVLLEMGRRSARPAIIIDVMASMIASVIKGAAAQGVPVNLDKLASPYLDLMDIPLEEE